MKAPPPVSANEQGARDIDDRNRGYGFTPKAPLGRRAPLRQNIEQSIAEIVMIITDGINTGGLSKQEVERLADVFRDFAAAIKSFP